MIFDFKENFFSYECEVKGSQIVDVSDNGKEMGETIENVCNGSHWSHSFANLQCRGRYLLYKKYPYDKRMKLKTFFRLHKICRYSTWNDGMLDSSLLREGKVVCLQMSSWKSSRSSTYTTHSLACSITVRLSVVSATLSYRWSYVSKMHPCERQVDL